MRWIRASATTDIERPVDEVFAWVSNPDNLGAWLPGVRNGDLTSVGRLQTGSTIRALYEMGGPVRRFDFMVTDHDPPQRFALRATDGPFPLEAALDLRARGDGLTRIRVTTRSGSDSWYTGLAFAVLGPILRRQVAGRLEECLAALKAELESHLEQPVRVAGEAPGFRSGGPTVR